MSPLSQIVPSVVNPDVQKRVEKGMEKGIEKGMEKGREEGRLQGLQRSVLKIVKKRFPSLMDLAQQRVVAITDQDELDQLIDQLLVVSDEAEVRRLLRLPLA
jgi:flagellar biosynthesis/type III secretory pathway protein FliH